MFIVSDKGFPNANRHDEWHVHPALQGQPLQEEVAFPGGLTRNASWKRAPGIRPMLLHESKVIPGRTRDEKQSQPCSAREGLALRNHPRQARPRQSSHSLKETLTGSLLCTLKSPSGWVYAFLCSPKSCTHRALNKVST